MIEDSGLQLRRAAAVGTRRSLSGSGGGECGTDVAVAKQTASRVRATVNLSGPAAKVPTTKSWATDLRMTSSGADLVGLSTRSADLVFDT